MTHACLKRSATLGMVLVLSTRTIGWASSSTKTDEPLPSTAAPSDQPWGRVSWKATLDVEFGARWGRNPTNSSIYAQGRGDAVELIDSEGKDLRIATTDEVSATRRIGVLIGHETSVSTMAFSPSGRLLASGDEGGDVIVWNVKEKSAVAHFTGHTNAVEALAFDPTERYVASRAGIKGEWALWDVWNRNATVIFPMQLGYADAVTADGRLEAKGSEDGSVTLWDKNAEREFATLPGDGNAVLATAFSPKGDLLACGGKSAKVTVWNVRANKTVQMLSVDPDWEWTLSISFSPDSRLLAVGNGKGLATLFMVKDGRKLAVLSDHVGAVSDLEFSVDGRLLGSAGADGKMVLWDVDNRPLKSRESKDSTRNSR